MEPKQKPYKFVVRFPIQLRNQIADAATYYRRSMNSEIVARLEHSFSGIPSASDEYERAPHMHSQIESFLNRTLSNDEEQVVRAFRRLTEEKRKALLELLV